MGVVSCREFNLAHTLDSGQFFRYFLHEGWYYIVTRDKVFRVRQEGNVLYYEGASERFVKYFFALDENYSQIKKKLHKDPALAPAFRRYPGMRIMRQDPWECTVAFLCSQFSNIKKIKKNLELIAQKFGKKTVFKGKQFFTFPNPGEINNKAKLKSCAVGFRAKYIFGTNSQVNDSYFSRLRSLPYERAREKIMQLPGIGEKVSDCILLFSLGKSEAFPVDVWMERALKETYFPDQKIALKKMAAFGRERWGQFAGYAQQYLYHARRLK